MIPHTNKKFWKKALLCWLLMTVLAAAAWQTGRLNALGRRPERIGLESDHVTELFRAFGIIRLPGLVPPVEVRLQDTAGTPVKLSDFKGKIVFLNFWTTWCPDCIAEMPGMEKLHRQFKEEDFAMVAINLRESPSKVSAFLKAHDLTFTALLDTDGSVGTSFAIRSIPTTYILDKQGGLIGKTLGSRDWGGRKARQLFEVLVSASHTPQEPDK